MVGIGELERHYHEDEFNRIPPEAFITAAQAFLGLNPQEYPDRAEYDALVSAAGEPQGSVEQRLRAGHLVDTLFTYTMNSLPGEEIQAPATEDVRALYQAEQAQARLAREGDPDNAAAYPDYTLEHAHAAAQKRQTWLTGILLHELDDQYKQAPSIKAAIAQQRIAYRLVETTIAETIKQDRLADLAAQVAQAEEALREKSPLLYSVYRVLAWAMIGANRLITGAAVSQAPPREAEMVQ